jgi:hypothetical protein
MVLPGIALASGWRAAVRAAATGLCAMFAISALAYRRPRRSALAFGGEEPGAHSSGCT